MSIIQDALKKIQEPDVVKRQESETAAPRQEQSPAGSAQEKAGQPLIPKTPVGIVKRVPVQKYDFRPAVILAIIFVIVAAAGFAAKYFMDAARASAYAKKSYEAESKDPSSYQEVTYKPVKSDPEAQPSLSSIIKPAAPDLVLNGIMYLEAGPRAIINNSIVGKDEMVNGARVVTINKRSVVLAYDGVEITLNLK